MGLEKRLEKLESASGINTPCPCCANRTQTSELINDFHARIGFKVQQPRPCDRVTSFCPWCLRPDELDFRYYTDSERALWNRWAAMRAAGLVCSLEFERADAELKEAFETIDRRTYGAHYEEYHAMIDEQIARLIETVKDIPPKFIYLCRVPGCQCKYPKTEEQAHANLRANYKAA